MKTVPAPSRPGIWITYPDFDRWVRALIEQGISHPANAARAKYRVQMPPRDRTKHNRLRRARPFPFTREMSTRGPRTRTAHKLAICNRKIARHRALVEAKRVAK